MTNEVHKNRDPMNNYTGNRQELGEWKVQSNLYYEVTFLDEEKVTI